MTGGYPRADTDDRSSGRAVQAGKVNRLARSSRRGEQAGHGGGQSRQYVTGIRFIWQLTLSALTLMLAILPGPGFAQPPERPDTEAAMFRGGPRLDGVYRGRAPRALIGVVFKFRADGPIRSTPAVAGGTLFVGSADHRLYALDAVTGVERWRFEARAGVSSSPAVSSGLVFFTSRDGTLYALNAASGKLVWRLAFGLDLGSQNFWDFYTSSPVPVGNLIYVGSGDGCVYAVDSRTGRIRWKTALASRVRSTPAVEAGQVVVGTMDGRVVSLDARNGVTRWSFSTDGAGRTFETKGNDTTSIFASPTIADNSVLIGARDGMLYALDLATGRLKWKETHDGGSWVLGTGARGGRVISPSGSAFFVQASDLADGKMQWRFRTGSAVFGSPTLVDGVVLADDLAGSLYAIDETDGRELWRFALGDRSFATPVVADGMVYAASDDGVLYALRTSPTSASNRHVTRLVYRAGQKSKTAFAWFQHNIDLALLGQLKDGGYQQVDATELAAAMEKQVRGGGVTVVVFADANIPATVLERIDARALLRRFLEAGGRVVVPGGNPVAAILDTETGALTGTDADRVEAVLGIRYPPPQNSTGYHVSQVTMDGRAWGLDGFLVTNVGIDPAQVTRVLFRDEYGQATAWVREYGSLGGSFVQLTIPRNRVVDFANFQRAAEHGLGQPPKTLSAQ